MANEIIEITDAEFDELLEEPTPQFKKWNDLEINKIYIVTNTTVVDTQMGESMVVTLKDNGAVWVPDHLKKRVVEKNISPPFYIRPQGMKPCKNNPTNRYYAYDLVVATKIEEITEAKFDQMLEEQAPQYKKWGDLEIKKIYVVTDTTIVSTTKR